MRLFIIRKKGEELNSTIFTRKGILQAVFQRFFYKFNWRKHKIVENAEDFEVVELEVKVKQIFEIADLKENIGK